MTTSQKISKSHLNMCTQHQPRDMGSNRAGASSSNKNENKNKNNNNNNKNKKKNNNNNKNNNNSSFAKITTLVFLIAIADVIFVWYSINASIGGELQGDEPHHMGAEAGLHHLLEKKRMKQVLRDHISNNEKVKQEQPTMKGQNQHQKFSSTTNEQQKPDDKIMLEKAQQIRRHMGRKGKNHDTVIGNDLSKVSSPEKQNIDESSSSSSSNSPKKKVDERITAILKSAHVNLRDLDATTISQLPTWENVISQYGDHPILYGLETCQPYRATTAPADRMIGPAGMFNTGTNLFFQLMNQNCYIPEAAQSTTHEEKRRNGVRFQPPWGKHNPPATHRYKNIAKVFGVGINQTAFFPVVMIKDPYGWMGSECRHNYQTWWEHDYTDDGNGCPNLVNKRVLERVEPVEAMVHFPLEWVYYESLIDVWNKWYEEYEEQTFPMLHTRFEDLLFHGEEVTKLACDCVGGVFARKFQYIEGSAKENGMPIHEGANGLVNAMVQYGNPRNRLNGMTDRDRRYASESLNGELMSKFGYSAPPLPT